MSSGKVIGENTTIKYQLPYLDEFLLHLKSDNFSEETVYNYERDLNTFEFFLNNDIKKPFKKIEKMDILRFKAYLASSDRKTAKMHNSEHKLGSFFHKQNIIGSAVVFKNS